MPVIRTLTPQCSVARISREMWSFIRSKSACPIDADRQKWVDYRFDWLLKQFGEEIPRSCNVILPTPEFFPDVYSGKESDVQVMLNRVAGYMNVDPSRFKLFIYSEKNGTEVHGTGLRSTSGSAGLYVRSQSEGESNAKAAIGIEAKQLNNPMGLVATLAHEIGHELLLGEKRVTRDESDHEPLTDLLTVFLGLGIFGCNATIQDRAWSDGTWAGWSTSRSGYLDQRMFGYAMALFARTREESKPNWLKHVRADVRSVFKQAMCFLEAKPKSV
jgi:hypothetical protein